MIRKAINQFSVYLVITSFILITANAQNTVSSTVSNQQTFTSIASDTIGNQPPDILPSASNDDNNTKSHRLPLSQREFILSLCILGFGILIILVIFFGPHQTDSDGTFKLATVALVITSALFLVIAGYSSEQIAPVIGLLGTIAGYLLGKASNTKNNQ